MNERSIVAAGIAALAGAAVAHPVAPAVVLVAVAGLAMVRRPWIVCLAAAVFASGWGARAWDGLDPVRPHAVHRARATLVSDPIERDGSIVVLARVDGRRFELVTPRHAPGASTLAGALSGERVIIDGAAGPFPSMTQRRVTQHLVGRIRVRRAGAVMPAMGFERVANAARRTLERGAAPLPARLRPLYTGMVYGDDRQQPLDIADAFRGAGLSHLLAVSGQNVAFVIVVSTPLLRRVRIPTRFLLTAIVIGGFAIVTRCEPSVLRATVMTGVAALATALGRPASTRRVIASSVVVLVAIDPLVVRSLGFQLSLAATVAIVELGPGLARAMPFPASVASPLSVTIAAQLGVAPLLVAAFGSVPTASLPANLLAVPVAGALMMWGLTAGLVAGVCGGTIAAVLQAPTALALQWVAMVAERSAMAGLAELNGSHVAALVVAAVVVVVVSRPRTRHSVLGAALVGAVAVACRPAVVVDGASGLTRDADLWRAGAHAVVVLEPGVYGPDVLAGLRRAHVRRLDAVVLAGAGDADPALVEALRHRYRPVVVRGSAELDAGRIHIDSTADGRVRVRLTSAGPDP